MGTNNNAISLIENLLPNNPLHRSQIIRIDLQPVCNLAQNFGPKLGALGSTLQYGGLFDGPREIGVVEALAEEHGLQDALLQVGVRVYYLVVQGSDAPALLADVVRHHVEVVVLVRGHLPVYQRADRRVSAFALEHPEETVVQAFRHDYIDYARSLQAVVLLHHLNEGFDEEAGCRLFCFCGFLVLDYYDIRGNAVIFLFIHG